MNKRTIIFDGICYWCTENTFKEIPGVIRVQNGHNRDPATGTSLSEMTIRHPMESKRILVDYDADRTDLGLLLTSYLITQSPGRIKTKKLEPDILFRHLIIYADEEAKLTKEIVSGTLAVACPEILISKLEAFDSCYEVSEGSIRYQKNLDAVYCEYVFGPGLKKYQAIQKELLN